MDLSTSSLFSEKRLAIIDPADEKKIDLGRLPTDDDLTIILVFGKELSSASVLMKELIKRKAQVFATSTPQDKSIFLLLDLVAEKNKKAFGYMEKLMQEFGGIYLLTMLLFLLRRLVLPTTGVAPFIAQKTEKQRKNFSVDELKQLYKEVLRTEYLIKTGKAEEKSAILLLVHRMVS